MCCLLKNRVLAGWIIAFTIGVSIGLYTDGKIRVALFVIIGVFCGVMLAAHRFCAFNLKRAVIAGLIIIMGMTYSAAYTVFVFLGSGEYASKEDIVFATVIDIGSYAEGGYFDISVKESRLGISSGTRVRLYYTGSLTEPNTGREILVRRGDALACTVTYKKHNSNRLFSKNIYITAQGSVESVTTGGGFFYELRQKSEKVTDKLFADYPDEVGAIAKTLIVGETADMDSYVYELFRNGGVSHLLVISGLHIAIIVMSLYGLLEFFTVRRQFRSIICLLVLLAYAFFIGFSPSISRATVMTGIMFLCMLATRRADSITSLFLALFILLLVNPYNVFSVGLGLSFLSCMGILILSPYLLRPVSGKSAKLKKIIKALLTPLIFTLAATIFTFPILLSTFDSVSYISPLINIIITPLYTYLLVILVSCTILFALFGVGVTVLSFIPGKIILYSYKLLDKLYEADIGSFSSNIPFIVLPLLFALVTIFALCILKRKKMFIAVGVLSVCFSLSIIFCIINFNIQSENTTITALNDSYAYKSLFIADGDECIFMELGGKKSGISTVYKHGYCKLDYYVMNDITESDVVKLENALAQINIKSVYIPKVISRDKELHRKIKLLANSRKCDIIEYNTTLFENIGSATITVKRNKDFALSASFIAAIKRSGQSIRVFGGERIDSALEYGYSNAVITLKNFEKPYDNIICDYRCMKVKDNNFTENKGETVYNYSDTNYVQIELKNKSLEVSLNEP